MTSSDLLPRAGDIVHVRHRQYLVDSIHLRQDVRDDHTLVRLVCLDDDAQGRPLSVLWERELGASIVRPHETGIGTPTKLDPPRHFAAYLHALKWSSVTATDARLFQAPFRAGIHLFDHQLTPLKKALELPRVNLFIADDVGLGKTIEAGLVMQELMLRQRADFVLVVCPASVTLQWRDEMEKRFGLQFAVFTRDFVARRRQERGFQQNPWKTHNRFIVSYQLLRRSDYYEELRNFLAERGHHRALLVLDEAHVVAPASATRYAVDTETTRAIRAITDSFEHRLFLSATPHNGHSNSFSALLEMLDPQRFTRGTRVRQSQLEAVMVRRLKADLRATGTAINYPERQVLSVELTHANGRWTATWTGQKPIDLGEGPAAELDLARKLARYTGLTQPKNKRGRLVFINLQKRLLSSIEAFHRTLSVHAGSAPPTDDLLHSESAGDEYGPSDEELELVLDQEVEHASQELDPSAEARKLLEEMLAQAERYRGVPDAKLRALLQWIRANMSPLSRGAKWTDRRIIIFTEYGHTLRYLREALSAAFEGTDRDDERILTFAGGMGDERRAFVQRAFNGDPKEHPVRVLLATDAAREGINLQGHCADLFHYDIPWNPSRLEQRNGRIDRALQPEPTVRCGYFVYTQREEDRVLDTLVRKVDVIHRELGSLGSVLMQQMETALAQGIKADSSESIERAAKPSNETAVAKELESSRNVQKLKAELAEVGRIKDDSRKVMDFDTALLRDALDVGFELSGGGKLAKIEMTDGGRTIDAWKVPPLPESWAKTLDSIRPPREKDETPWDWRARDTLPAVFEAPARIDSQVAQLHLSHPIVQRVLQRYLAQGFSASDLSRVTVVRSKRDSVARVIVFGRLSLFGPRAARLHDEVVSVAARWIEGGGRGHLKPFSEDADRKAIDQLEATLAEAPSLSSLPAALQKELLAAAPSDFAKLWSTVEDEAAKRADQAKKKLTERGAHEAKALAEILKVQEEVIDEALGLQLELELHSESDSGREQLEQWRRDRSHLALRKAALAKEMEEQPRQLQQAYEIQLSRLTPVGMVYLWPATR